MSTITHFNGLSTDELLRHVDEARAKSPIIEELCQRLEGGLLATEKCINISLDIVCPVCLAELTVTHQHVEAEHYESSPKTKVEAPL